MKSYLITVTVEGLEDMKNFITTLPVERCNASFSKLMNYASQSTNGKFHSSLIYYMYLTEEEAILAKLSLRYSLFEECELNV